MKVTNHDIETLELVVRRLKEADTSEQEEVGQAIDESIDAITAVVEEARRQAAYEKSIKGTKLVVPDCECPDGTEGERGTHVTCSGCGLMRDVD